MAALDIYAKQEQWEKCLEVAAKQVSACVSPQGQSWGSGALEGVGAQEAPPHCPQRGQAGNGAVLEPWSLLCSNFVINGALEGAK